MSKVSDGRCKKFHGGRWFKKLLVVAAIVGLFYGALYRVSTRTWPWQDWNAFVHFSSESTRSAIEKGRDFTRERVVPGTQKLLARAQHLLERWDTDEPQPPEEETPDAQPEEEALGIGSTVAAEGGEGLTEQAAASAASAASGASTGSAASMGTGAATGAVASPTAKEVVPEKGAPRGDRNVDPARTDSWRQGRQKFKDGLRHYQRSSPEMEGSQDQLRAAREKFRESLVLFEEAQQEDPDNHLIERDLQEVQTFLIDCQRRLQIETKSY